MADPEVVDYLRRIEVECAATPTEGTLDAVRRVVSERDVARADAASLRIERDAARVMCEEVRRALGLTTVESLVSAVLGVIAERDSAVLCALEARDAECVARDESHTELMRLRKLFNDANNYRSELRGVWKRVEKAVNERDEARAAYLDVCRAVGIVYTTDGRAAQPGPLDVVLEAIRSTVRERDEALDRIGCLEADLRAAVRADDITPDSPLVSSLRARVEKAERELSDTKQGYSDAARELRKERDEARAKITELRETLMAEREDHVEAIRRAQGELEKAERERDEALVRVKYLTDQTWSLGTRGDEAEEDAYEQKQRVERAEAERDATKQQPEVVNGCLNCGRYDNCPYGSIRLGRGNRTSCVEYWQAIKQPESEHDICAECGGLRGRWPACTCTKFEKAARSLQVREYDYGTSRQKVEQECSAIRTIESWVLKGPNRSVTVYEETGEVVWKAGGHLCQDLLSLVRALADH